MGRIPSLFGSVAAVNVMSHFGLTETAASIATGHSGGGPEAFFYTSLAGLAGWLVTYKTMRRMGNAI